MNLLLSAELTDDVLVGIQSDLLQLFGKIVSVQEAVLLAEGKISEPGDLLSTATSSLSYFVEKQDAQTLEKLNTRFAIFAAEAKVVYNGFSFRASCWNFESGAFSG